MCKHSNRAFRQPKGKHCVVKANIPTRYTSFWMKKAGDWTFVPQHYTQPEIAGTVSIFHCLVKLVRHEIIAKWQWFGLCQKKNMKRVFCYFSSVWLCVVMKKNHTLRIFTSYLSAFRLRKLYNVSQYCWALIVAATKSCSNINIPFATKNNFMMTFLG